MAAAMQEKHLQNPGVKKALLATSDPILEPVTTKSPQPPSRG